MATHVLSGETRRWLDQPRPFWVDGQSVETSQFRALTNPATGEEFGFVHTASSEHVDAAVTAARRRFDNDDWRLMNAAERAKILWRLANLIDLYADELAELETLCMGKPFVAASTTEVPYFAETFRYFAGWCTKIMGQSGALSFPAGDLHGLTLREPVGVVGMILPWNGPLVIGGWKIAPALATGCTCVIKPADITPLSLLRFAELAQEAGIPDGVINVVTGPGSDVGAAMASHDGIDKIAFTGSGAVGRDLMHRSADGNLKKLTLELGGKSPVVVFPDADLDEAVAGVADAIFGNSGQVCVAGSRLYVHHSIRSAFTEKLVAHADGLKLGDPFDPSTDLGPIASESHRQSIHEHVAIGIEQGAHLVCGGTMSSGPGAFYPPTILDVDDQANSLVQDEVFGPVLCVAGFDGEDEAVGLANGTRYALAASVWTKDIDRALRMSRRLACGIVWVNTHNVPDLHMPIGGYGESGWGRELGEQGLAEFLQSKSVMIRIAPNAQGASS